MSKEKHQEHWAYSALRKRLAEKTQTIIPNPGDYAEGEPKVLRIVKTPDWQSGTIFLFDPLLKSEISDFFYKSLYPQILNVFEDEPFEIPPADKIELRESPIKGASCNAIFIVTDQKRPITSTERPWWYIRFSLDVETGRHYFLQTELFLSIPFNFESDWMLDFMIAARHWAIPPTLRTGSDRMTLEFASGKDGFYPSSDDGNCELTARFRKHLQLVKAIDLFSENPKNRFLKSHMLQTISEFYGKY